MTDKKEIIEKDVFIKIAKGEEVISFIHVPFTKKHKEILLKWLAKQK